MANQNLLPGIGFINESVSNQNLIPGLGFVNESRYSVYFVIGSETNWTTPQASDIVNGKLAGGTASVASGSEAVPLGTALDYEFDAYIDGLSAGNYYIAFVWSDGVEFSDVTVSEVFTITASDITTTGLPETQENISSVDTITQVHVTVAANSEQSNYSTIGIIVIPGSAPTLSGITLINVGTTYGTPRVTITFS